MKKQDIEIGDKKYTVLIAESQEDKIRGLSKVEKLPEGKGMLFVWDEPQEVSMTMKDTLIPLDQIFIDEDGEVIKIAHRNDTEKDELVSCENTKSVLEVNINSGIEEGDYLDSDLEDDDPKTPVMKVLAPDGSTQMELEGGERIFSRKNTKVLIRQAKKANNSKSDSDYKRLGKSVFKFLNIQDNRDPEYVKAPK